MASRSNSSKSSPDIVLADDEQFIRAAYKEGLEREGFSVETAADGASALELVKQKQPSLVMLDIIMPKLNGFDVLKEIKNNPGLKDIKVVILTNLSKETDEREVREMGGHDFIVKSDNSMSEIVEKVKSYLK